MAYKQSKDIELITKKEKIKSILCTTFLLILTIVVTVGIISMIVRVYNNTYMESMLSEEDTKYADLIQISDHIVYDKNTKVIYMYIYSYPYTYI